VLAVDELVNGPIATKAYKDALYHKTTLFLGGVLFLGPQGGGKTSLLRSLIGETFRLVERPSQSISIKENCSLMLDNVPWHDSTSGLVYEDELVKIGVDELLKYTHGENGGGANGTCRKSITSTVGMSYPPPGINVGHGERNGDISSKSLSGESSMPPPLPQARAVRSHSFSSANSLSVQPYVVEKDEDRFCGSYDSAERSLPDDHLQSELKEQGNHKKMSHLSKGKKGLTIRPILTRRFRDIIPTLPSMQ